MISFYRNFIGKGDLCYDIGANLGERTECFIRLGANVISVEPQTSCFNHLVRKFGKTSQVKLLPCALGGSEGEGYLLLCDETEECSTLSLEFIATYGPISNLHWSKKEKVKIRTLQSLCDEFGAPIFCKLDVEGYESEVLRGLHYPIRNISFEFNRALLKDTQHCFKILKNLGKYQCNFIAYEHMKFVMPKWISLEEFSFDLEKIITSDIITGEIFARLKI